MDNADINYEDLLDEVIKVYNPLSTTQTINEQVRQYLGRSLFFGNFQTTPSDTNIFHTLNLYLENKYGYGNKQDKTCEHYTANHLWKEATDKGGHYKYQEYIKRNKEQELEDADLYRRQRVIDIQNAELENQIKIDIILDYPKIKTQRNILFIIAIISTLIAIAVAILKK